MDHSYIEEHQIVDRYLMEQLPAEERVSFEDHYVHCSTCLDQLELAEKFQYGFKRATAQEVTRVAVSQQLGLLAWLSRQGRTAQSAWLAALLAVAVLPAGFLYRDLGQARSALETFRAPQLNTAVLTLGPERSAPQEDFEPTHRIRLSGEPEWIVLSLELDAPDAATYRVTLLRGGDTEVWHGGGLEPNSLDALVLSLHSSWLAAGDYVARVEAPTSGGSRRPVAHFSFRVIANG